MLLKLWKNPLTVLIFGILGSIVGVYFGEIELFKNIGGLFIRLIKMLTLPIVISAVLLSILQFRETRDAGRLGGIAVVYFLFASIVSATLGAFLIEYFKPGKLIQNIPSEFLNGVELYSSKVNANPTVSEFLINLIAQNPFASIVNMEILQTVIFILILGIALNSIHRRPGVDYIKGMTEAFSEAMGWLIKKILFLSPLFVFSLMAYTTGSTGYDILFVLLKYFLLYVLGWFLWVFVVAGIIIALIGKISYLSYLKETITLHLNAFASSSSLVCLPINQIVLEKLGVDEKIRNFVLPIGTTLNLNGTAMHYTMAALFFAQVFNVPLDLLTIIAVIFVAVISSVAAAGTPGTTLLIVAGFGVANIPIAGLPLLFSVDRFFDMIATSFNTLGNTLATLVINKIHKIGKDSS